MKHIKHYKIFESTSPNFPSTKEGVIEVCEKYKIKNYTINNDLSIDVDGNVIIGYTLLEYLPLRFNHVSGYFDCSGNRLKSLEGSPQTLDSGFYCTNNNLESLKGCPQTISDSFICYFNELKSLEGGPQKVNGSFDCSNNKLESLEGCTQTVSGSFYCYDNELKSLEGSPQTISGDFYCFDNNLVSLEGCPHTINGDFMCSDNKLTDLEHFPNVEGHINIAENKVHYLVYTFINKADSFIIEDFTDYEIVRNGNTVMLDRLQTFIRDNDLEMPDLEEIKKHYKIIE